MFACSTLERLLFLYLFFAFLLSPILYICLFVSKHIELQIFHIEDQDNTHLSLLLKYKHPTPKHPPLYYYQRYTHRNQDYFLLIQSGLVRYKYRFQVSNNGNGYKLTQSPHHSIALDISPEQKLHFLIELKASPTIFLQLFHIFQSKHHLQIPI